MATLIDNVLGQLGDAAIQFVGNLKDDVFTPSSFTFSSENESTASTPSYATAPADIGQMVAIGASGISLAATAGIITVASNILSKLNQIEKNLNTSLLRLENVDRKIDRLLSITKRIDIKVSESHLRESIRHLLRTSISEEGIDMNRLAQIGNDIDNMLESLDGGLLGNPSVKLSTDVRALLESIYLVFSASRRAFCTAYNQRHCGEGAPLLPVDRLDDWYLVQDVDTVAKGVVRIHHLSTSYLSLVEESLQFISTKFSFCDDEDREAMKEMFGNFADEKQGLFGSEAEVQIYQVMPEDVFFGEDHDQQVDTVRSYLEAWVWKTDAGLLRRLQLELMVFKNGYDSLLNEKIKSNRLTVSSSAASSKTRFAVMPCRLATSFASSRKGRRSFGYSCALRFFSSSCSSSKVKSVTLRSFTSVFIFQFPLVEVVASGPSAPPREAAILAEIHFVTSDSIHPTRLRVTRIGFGKASASDFISAYMVERDRPVMLSTSLRGRSRTAVWGFSIEGLHAARP